MAAKKEEKKNNTAYISDKAERRAAVENAVKMIEKDFGAGSIMRLGDRINDNIDVISTGVLSLDSILGVGGLPRGRIVEIYGPEASGKATIALQCIAQVQKAGGYAAFIDAKHAIDPEYAKALGVDINELYVSQPDSGEQALDICEALVRCGAIDMVVIDSVAALVPKQELEGDMGESHVGLQARLMSQALRKLTGAISKSNAIVIFINQLREKVGIMYGNPEVTTGGKALKFYASVRIDVRKGEPLKDGFNVIGNRVRIKVVKNKVAPPFKSTIVDIIYGKGVSAAGDMLEIAVAHDIIKKTGAWYSYEGNRIAQGRENAVARLEDDKLLFEEIFGKVKVLLKDLPIDSLNDEDYEDEE